MSGSEDLAWVFEAARDNPALLDRWKRLAAKGAYWQPRSPPQLLAVVTPAYWTLYGGQAGGGKTDLLVGLATGHHRTSYLVRREETTLVDIRDRIFEACGRDAKPGGKMIHLPGGRRILLAASKNPLDWGRYKGRARDFLGIDEASDLLASQVIGLKAWVRTKHRGQRCRVVMATNPPTAKTGAYLLDWFAPWLDPAHPNPARAGEVRTRKFQRHRVVDCAVDDPDGETWTFIPASLEDNPFLRSTGYRRNLDALPEPLRSMLAEGKWSASLADDAFQMIPRSWVLAAQARWDRNRAPDRDTSRMSLMAADISQGGGDDTVVGCARGLRVMPLTVAAGPTIQSGAAAAGLIVSVQRDGAAVVVDFIGPGANVHEHLTTSGMNSIAYVGSSAATMTDRSGLLKFSNLRTQAYWKLREALDPEYGAAWELPPDDEITRDLTSVMYSVERGTIIAEPKERMVARIGRSTDRGDVIAMLIGYGALLSPQIIEPRRVGNVVPYDQNYRWR